MHSGCAERIREALDQYGLGRPDVVISGIPFSTMPVTLGRSILRAVWSSLKPGGRFYHCDMLRPANRTVEELYYAYLRFCLWLTGFLFRSGPAALNCKDYFIQALRMFYSAQELSDLLEDTGFRDVTSKTVFYGMLGFHRAVKPG